MPTDGSTDGRTCVKTPTSLRPRTAAGADVPRRGIRSKTKNKKQRVDGGVRRAHQQPKINTIDVVHMVTEN
jgi:hypothetical protein